MRPPSNESHTSVFCVPIRGDLFKMIREDTSSQQPGHTSADYDGVLPVELALCWLLATHDFPSSVPLSGSITWMA
jgi:hypothetical protein